jgi:hypothetical protein
MDLEQRTLLLALARRCETEPPSRELDEAIAKGLSRDQVLDYTTSVDAARSLEPASAQEICIRVYPGSGAYVRISPVAGHPVYCESFAKPIMEAAARTATALRAMARA